MQENRKLRLQSAIQEELAQFVSREVKDPRIPPLTFTEVKVSSDGSHATIFVSILGSRIAVDESEAEARKAAARMKDCLEGLQAASGFIRRHLSKALGVRHTPSLLFREDRGFENAAKVQDLLEQLRKNPAEG